VDRAGYGSPEPPQPDVRGTGCSLPVGSFAVARGVNPEGDPREVGRGCSLAGRRGRAGELCKSPS